MESQVEDKGDGSEDAEVCDPRRDNSRTKIYENEVLPGYSNRKMANLSKSVANALRGRHLSRSFENNIDQAEATRGQLETVQEK